MRECSVIEMRITIREACVEDAAIIGELRRLVWLTTYRGIYPDDKLDHYPYQEYLKKDSASLSDKAHHWYLFCDGPKTVGYFSFGPYNYGHYKDFSLCLNHLYILKDYQGMGLGKRAFDLLNAFCTEHRIARYFCGCNANNGPAISFYQRMGGIAGDAPRMDVAKEDQIIHFEFYLGD